MVFRFCCDESHEGVQDPNTYTISGFFSDQPTWEDVEERWHEINCSYGVPRFHAQHLNRRSEEYEGWCKCKGDSYSAELLKLINDQGNKMRAYNCGMHSDAYRSLISDKSRDKLGHPWMVCFNSCVAMIAKDMESLPQSDMISVVVERGGGFDQEAVESFQSMRANPDFAYRHRLMTCAPATPEMSIGLQVADLMAYEYFKQLNDRSRARDMRAPYDLIRQHNTIVERFFGSVTLTTMKDRIESSDCGPGQLVIIPTLE